MTTIDWNRQSPKFVVYLKNYFMHLTSHSTSHIHTVSAFPFYNNALTTLGMGTALRSDPSLVTDNQKTSSEPPLKTYKIGHLPPPLNDLRFTTSDRPANDDYLSGCDWFHSVSWPVMESLCTFLCYLKQQAVLRCITVHRCDSGHRFLNLRYFSRNLTNHS